MNGGGQTQDFVTRNLSEHDIAHLFVDGIPSAFAQGNKVLDAWAFTWAGAKVVRRRLPHQLVAGKSWLDRRLKLPACTTKVVCEPRRGLPLHYRSGRVYRPDARTAMEALPGIIRANDDPSWG